MLPSYGPASVQMFGGLLPDDEIIHNAKIDLLGESPHATAALYAWEPGKIVGNFRRVDTLTEATITGSDTAFTVSGTSQQLIDDVGLGADDAQVRWVVTVKGCAGCN